MPTLSRSSTHAACATVAGPKSAARASIHTRAKKTATKEPILETPEEVDTGIAGVAAIAGGIVANPIMLWSEYTLKTTGAGLPPGPSGALGAAGAWRQRLRGWCYMKQQSAILSGPGWSHGSGGVYRCVAALAARGATAPQLFRAACSQHISMMRMTVVSAHMPPGCRVTASCLHVMGSSVWPDDVTLN